MASFDSVLDVAAVMRGFRGPWYIAGGWAIELFIGRVSRNHEDLDVAVFRRDQEQIRAYLSDWTLEKVVQSRREPWEGGERLELPVHEIHAYRTRGSPAELELLLNEVLGDRWVFRRDARITRSLPRVEMRTDSGIPFLAPEIALLYKAKRPGAKDEADFNAARLHLEPEPREWLRCALETCQPDHPWIRRL